MLAPASPPREDPHPPCLEEALSLPLALAASLRLSPEEFAELCAANPEAVLELAADGSLILMTPTGSETGGRNGALSGLLWQALRSSGLSLKLFDSSSGFRLPDGSVRSPDASLVALDRWQALTAEQRRGFAPLCPDLVVELASPSDEGARLGWLLIPAERAVEVWGPLADPPHEPSRIEKATRLDGGPEFPGLVIELEEIWAD